MEHEVNELVTARGVAERTGYPYQQLWTYLKRGTLPQADYKVENKPLWKKETIDKWLEERDS